MKSRDFFIHPKDEQAQRQRIQVFLIWSFVLLTAFLGRLWYLQIIKHVEFVHKAQMQSSKSRVLLSQRGLILDRNDQVLVGNQPGLRLRFFPERAENATQTVQFLQSVLSNPPVGLPDRIDQAMRYRPFRTITVVEQLSRDELAKLEARRFEFPELEIQTIPLRRYPHEKLAAHLLGYLGEISDTELKSLEGQFPYSRGDIIGKTGIEHVYDSWLFGIKGERQFRVDAYGQILELLDEKNPVPGWDLQLTIDLPTQQTAERMLDGKRGAIVAMDPQNGEIIAIASAPAFDPAQFIGGISHTDWNQLRNDPDHPLEYRPIRGMYPPGSTLKPLIAMAALQDNVITEDETIPCNGYYTLGNRTFRCWKKEGHGEVNLHKAILESCDTFFYEIGKRLGIERIAEIARQFGLGTPTGIDLLYEKGGLVPDPEWKRQTNRGHWNQGETIITAIGQGSLLVTPLQLARMYAAFANGLNLVTPHVYKGFHAHGRESLSTSVPSFEPQRLPIDYQHLDAIHDAMVSVVQDNHGTGGWARIRGIEVAGKTGTAQVVQQTERKLELEGKLKDHAWFAAYAPADAPRIVVVVLIENGGNGSSAAAPLARQVIQTYLRGT